MLLLFLYATGNTADVNNFLCQFFDAEHYRPSQTISVFSRPNTDILENIHFGVVAQSLSIKWRPKKFTECL